MPETVRGRCLCGAVTFEYDGPENWCDYCHCESCRRATSAPVAAFIGIDRARFRFTGAAPSVHESSPGVRRPFCGRCGSPIGYDADAYPDEIHVYAVCLEDPSQLRPSGHSFHAERLPWFETADDLPRHDGLG